MIKKIALAWMLLGALLTAQQITQIKFIGLAHLSPSVAEEIAGIKTGDQIDATKINKSIQNFFSQGYFKDVWVEKQGSTLIYHFKEKVAIAKIEIKGYGSGDEGIKLLEGIGLKKGDLYDEREMNRAKEALISKLEAEGYYDTVVEISKVPVGENSVALTFEVNKGEKIKIKKINFTGAKELGTSDLEFDLANKEEDFLGWMPFMNNGVARIDQLEYDALRLKDVYMKHGYVDAYVSKPLMRVDFGSYHSEIDYQIKEGKQYRIGDVRISQKIDGLDSEALLGKLTLKKGKIFNIKRMRKDIQLLKEAVGNLGYAYAQVVPQMHKNPQDNTISIEYMLRSGKKVTINDVIITGNESTKDRVIRRYLYLAPGDTYNATDLKDSKNALGRTGFFEKVDIQSQRISEDTINLLVKVKETATGTISAGGGYGSLEKLMVNASVSDKNFLGSGIAASAGFNLSKISTSYNLSFTNPKLWDSPYSLGFSLYKKNYKYTNFTQDQTGASLTLGREFLRHFHASVGAGYVDNQSQRNDNNYTATGSSLDNTIKPSEELIDRYYSDKYTKTSLYASLSFDNTDDFYTPRTGMIAAINMEFANLDGNDFNRTKYPGGYGNYVKTSGKLGLYYGVEDWIDYDLIFRFKARVSNIASTNGEKIPVAEKLFMGGINSVRGYRPYSITPGDEYGFITGGKKRASASIEASIPLSEAAMMRLTFFYDYGMIGENSFNEIKRSGAGAMIEWRSPLGPINLIFARALDDKKGDRTSNFEFSMGTKF